MTPTPIEDVSSFYTKYRIPRYEYPNLSNSALKVERCRYIHEEFIELMEAFIANDTAKALDALIDLTYIIHGTAIALGYGEIWNDAWDVVHDANMAKVSASTYRSVNDVVKPPGWQSPEPILAKLIESCVANYLTKIDMLREEMSDDE